ncbi:MAG TPA: AAA family ATPase [Candidatus Blautia excrementipullorum]|nr:AAA family ATPase [Candidatus Blautia excrementipullorum]
MRNNGIHIRIADIIYGIIKRRFLIIGLTVAGLLIGVVLSGISYLQGEMSKEYIITSSFSVNTQTDNGLFTSGYDFPSSSDIDMAKELTETVSYVLKSDKMLDEIIDSLGLLGVTTKDIADNLTLTTYGETQIIEMSLYWRSADEGINILSEINSQAPEMLEETLNIGNTAVINQPSAKYLIGGSVNVVLWGYLALLGFGLSIGIILLELIMRPTLLNVEDIENAYGLEVLCEIADDKAYFEKKRSILIDDGTSTDVRESFSSAAHIIQNHLRKKDGPHIIYITSALKSEGKTNVIANLGVQLAELEKKVLLIDLDMKNPNLGGLFLKRVDYDHSLNAFYAGDITKEEAVIPLTGYLDIMPTILERSAIPLDSNLFQVIREISEGYDYVLLDTAPVGLTADPMSLNQIASAALFVIRYDNATLQEIKEALERVEKSGVDLLGCVVNGIKVSRRGVKNPVKERENIRKAELKRDTLGEPLVNLENSAGENGFGTEKAENDSLVAGLAADEAAEREEEKREITSSGDFVDFLFQEESNQNTENTKKKNRTPENKNNK